MVDDDITSIFTAVAQDIEPDMAAVIAEATRRGRRRRARRRLALAGTAGASVVAIAVAATAAAHLASRPIHGSAPTGPSGRHAHAVTAKPHHTQPPVPQAHGPGMTPTQMLAVLRTMLPKGEVTYVAPYYMRGWLQLNFDDADGKGAVDMIVAVSGPETMRQLKAKLGYTHMRPSASQLRQDLKRANKRDELYCPDPLYKDEGKRPAGAPPISCTRSVLANGDIVMRLVTEADAYGYYDFAVYISRPDGVDVSIDVGNGTLEGTPHLAGLGLPWVDRAVPPGSLDFWETVVASSKWHL